jgi:hypothetical protein
MRERRAKIIESVIALLQLLVGAHKIKSQARHFPLKPSNTKHISYRLGQGGNQLAVSNDISPIRLSDAFNDIRVITARYDQYLWLVIQQSQASQQFRRSHIRHGA